ncbi:MAG: hypothetical protein ABIJ34_09125 [archaeon]
MELSLPFIKKKEKKKSAKELRDELKHVEAELKSTSHTEAGGDPIGGRLIQFGFKQEEFEKFQHRFVKTEFPTPDRRFRLVLEYPNFNIEQSYYWFLRYLQETWGFDDVRKVIDTYTSSVGSSMFGNMQSRLGAQQSQASQYLKGVSEMVKGLFQIVREIRVLDERLQYYYDSDGDKGGIKEAALSSEIVLKGLWIDQVEGGAKNPASVYGLSQTIGFTILPDLFFRAKISGRETIERDVDRLKFNPKVREILKRKLRQYYEWKLRTKKELKVRRDFEIKYLRQHYDTIRLYMSWVKPYLRNVKKLQMYEKNESNAHIISAFESQIIELELLFVRDDFGANGTKAHSAAVVSMHLFFRVKPEMSFHAYEYQNKGPIHAGMADITLRAYAWDDETLKNYIKYRQEDDLDLLASIDKSVAAAMDALGDELKKYLKEADPSMTFPGEETKKHDSHAGQSYPNILDPFVSVFKGFGDIFSSVMGGMVKPKEESHDEHATHKKLDASAKMKNNRVHHRASHFAVEACFESYMRYKMGPGSNLYWVEP